MGHPPVGCPRFRAALYAALAWEGRHSNLKLPKPRAPGVLTL